MTPVHILWTEPFKKNNKKIESCTHMFLSATMIKQVYGEIHVITDRYGEYLINQLGLPYDKVHLGLDQATSDFTFPDAKVLAYKMLSDIIPGYLYFDFDIFITRPVLKKDFIVQCDEGASPYPYRIYQYLIDKGIEFCYDYELSDLRFFNMGLFRCADKRIVYEYYESYFTTKYQNQYIKIDDVLTPQYVMFLEQNYIYKVLQKNNLLDQVHEHFPARQNQYNNFGFDVFIDKANAIMNEYDNDDLEFDPNYHAPSDIKNIDITGYTHLMYFKENEEVLTDVVEYAFTNYPKEFSKLMVKMKHIC